MLFEVPHVGSFVTALPTFNVSYFIMAGFDMNQQMILSIGLVVTLRTGQVVYLVIICNVSI